MKICRGIAAALVAAALCGCATVKVCREGGRTMAVIENTGWYLFNVLPIGSGDPDRPNETTFRIFENTVTVENNVKMLENLMAAEGADGYRNLNTYTKQESIMIALFKRYHCHTSVELSVPGGAEDGRPEQPEEEGRGQR